MEGLVVIKKIFELLDVDPIWGLILLAALVIRCFCPWKLTAKVEETQDEETGKKVYKVFQFHEK